MRITKNGTDKTISLIAGVSATVLPVLVDNNVITIHMSVLIGSVITAVIAGYHGSTVATNISNNNNDNYVPEHSHELNPEINIPNLSANPRAEASHL